MSIERILAPPLTQPRIVPKPGWLSLTEREIGRVIPWHPHVISVVKAMIAIPLVMALRQVGWLPSDPALILSLFGLFALLDYLDGVIAREHRQESSFGRVFDRITDLPLLVPVALFCCETLPALPVALKLGLDALLLLLFCLGRGPVENRIRTVMSYSVLLIMLVVSQGWLASLVTPMLATIVLCANVVFSALVISIRLGLLHRRFIADALSAANLLCGVASIVSAVVGAFPLCLVFLIAGAVFDGLDGAASRRWGGTRLGVYADDVADAVNYGIAPGVLLICALGGIEGWLLGVAYAVFTVGRLVYFTLNKDSGDPSYFSGLPSSAGALVVICAVLLFPAHPLLLGTMVGVACTLMVVFEARFRHLGRLLTKRPQIVFAAPILLVILIGSYFLFGVGVPAGLLLALALGYGFYRPVKLFGVKAREQKRRRADRLVEAPTAPSRERGKAGACSRRCLPRGDGGRRRTCRPRARTRAPDARSERGA